MSKTKTKYKVLAANQMSPYQDFKYRRRRWYHEPHIGEAGDSGCVRGLYATDVEGLLYRGLWRDDEMVYRCKAKGKQAGEPPLKECHEYLQVLEPVPESELRKLARAEHGRLGYSLEEALYPVHPLKIKRGPAAQHEIVLLEQWASAWASVRASVGASVLDSVGDSVGASVLDSIRGSIRGSVWASVGGSVWASVWAYAGSLFHGIECWKYIDHAPGEYPFRAAADLWRAGLVPSFDGQTWRLHAGKNAEIVYG